MTAIIEALVNLDPASLRTYILLASEQRGRANVTITLHDLATILRRSTRTVTRSIATLRAAKLVANTGLRSTYSVATKARN